MMSFIPYHKRQKLVDMMVVDVVMEHVSEAEPMGHGAIMVVDLNDHASIIQ